jgi:acyl-CoA thioester hydrolase
LAGLDGKICDGRHVMAVRVYYEDTDFSGIVYHANYLRFMERGRTNYLRVLGAEQGDMLAQARHEAPGFAFVVRSMQIEFLKPARMDDLLEVSTFAQEVKGASMLLRQRVSRADDTLVEALVRVACVCGGRACPIPKALRIAMRADMERAGGDGSGAAGAVTQP